MDKITKIIHNKITDNIIDPIYLGNINNIKIDDIENTKNIYGRCNNTTRELLENNLSLLEESKYSLTFSSGMSVIDIVSHLKNFNNGILASNDLYGGTKVYFNKIYKHNIEYYNFNLYNDIELDNIFQKFKNKVLWIESPSNPLLEIYNLEKISILCKKYNILSIIDNTFLTPVFQQPLKLGFDIVIHSISKYINGNSDVIMGCLMTNNYKIYEELLFYQKNIGSIPSSFDCYLVNRSIKTLYLRMKQHEYNAINIAKLLESNMHIEKVIYPGLKTYKTNFELNKQISGYGGMISFYIKKYINVNHFLNNLKIIYIAVSLGGPETLIQTPYNLTHNDLSIEEKQNLNITPYLIRLSVGLENFNDIYNDIDNSLNKI